MKCWLCNGEGDYPDPYDIAFFFECKECNGTGKIKFFRWIKYKLFLENNNKK